jgi:peptide subunit release factor 1 (eRF1)
MKLSNRQQIEAIARFHDEAFLTTSFFLNTDKGRLPKKEILVSAKNLLNNGYARIEALALPKEKKVSILKDLEKIGDYCANTPGANSPGLALFSCHGADFWQDFHLPHPPRNRLLFDHNPYIRPLSLILGRYHRVCVFLIGRREARWFSVYMGEITPLDSLTSDVPPKVKEGGFEGTAAKRIERHAEAHLLDHFKKSSQRTFDIFKKDQFDWLMLGCEDNYFSDLELYLHRYLLDRLKGRLKAKPSDTTDRILKEAVELEERINADDEQAWVKKYVAELEKGGRAVSGIKETLRALNKVEVQSLLVTHNFSAPGKMCPKCKFLYLDEAVCPSCDKPTESMTDVVDEGIEAAFRENAVVRHITPPSRLDHYGKIGALLRFKF